MVRKTNIKENTTPEKSQPGLLWDRSKEPREIVSPVQRKIRKQRGLNKFQRTVNVKNVAQPDFGVKVGDNILFKYLYGTSGLHIMWLLEQLTK